MWFVVQCNMRMRNKVIIIDIITEDLNRLLPCVPAPRRYNTSLQHLRSQVHSSGSVCWEAVGPEPSPRPRSSSLYPRTPATVEITLIVNGHRPQADVANRLLAWGIQQYHIVTHRIWFTFIINTQMLNVNYAPQSAVTLLIELLTSDISVANEW